MKNPFLIKRPLLLLWLLPGLICIHCNKNTEDKNPYPLAAEQNIDVEKLVLAFEKAAEIQDLQGIVISRNNITVAGEYYNEAGPGPDPVLHVMSVTKSITSTLVGIAIDNEYILSVDQTISDFLGEAVDTVNEALGHVTIRQLLTMSCGHDWQEIGSYSEFGEFVNAPDQLTYIFEKPIVNEPGTVFNYSDGAAHLVSAILEIATGMSASEFADQFLFAPMGISSRTWYSDNRSISYGGVGLCIGLEDMLKIGNLYLNNGMSDDRQIVSMDWIGVATQNHMATGQIIPFLENYGYYWWHGHAYGHDLICANGYGGQFIVVVDDFNLVVCSRCDYRNISREQAGQNWYRILDLILNDIIPAVND